MSETPDFVELARHYASLAPGQKAELRRIAAPEEVGERPAFYRLFPGQPATPQRARLVFLLPYAAHRNGVPSFARQLVAKKASEARLIQLIRAEAPHDLVYLRRLLHWLDQPQDWNEFGSLLWFWGEERKRRLLEDYFIAKTTPAKEKTHEPA